MAPLVSALSITAVKGTRLRAVPEVALGRSGVRADRRFYLIDAGDRMVNAKRLGALTRVLADYDDEERRLTLTFPDGAVAAGVVEPGVAVTTRFYSDSVAAREVTGPWSQALSAFLEQPVRLVEAPDQRGGVDRGVEGAATVISRASLARLADVGSVPGIDGRRFRMLIEIDGVDAHAEDAWVGRSVRIGDALVALRGNVGRCLITSRDPDTGEIDVPTLDILGSYRRDLDTTEALPFGVYGEVLEAGTVRVGDAVALS